MIGEDKNFMGTEYYGGELFEPLLEHRGKPDPAKVKARMEAHKRGLLRSKNARRREKEAEARRKEREKKRAQREKELKAMGLSDKDIKKQLEREDRDFEAQEKKRSEQDQLQTNGQQFSKEQVKEIGTKHKSALKDATAGLSKVEAKTKTEKQLVDDIQDYIDEVNSRVTDCIEKEENFDINQILDDTSSEFEKQLAEKDYDVDDFTDDFSYDDKTKKVTKKKKSKKPKISDDSNYRDLQDDDAKKNKKINDINRKIQELKSKHDDEIDAAKSDSERKRIYNRNKKKLDALKDELDKMEIKNRADYQDFKTKKRERRKERFDNNPAVMFFRYNFLKFTEPFVKFAGYYNDLYDYTTSNIGG